MKRILTNENSLERVNRSGQVDERLNKLDDVSIRLFSLETKEKNEKNEEPQRCVGYNQAYQHTQMEVPEGEERKKWREVSEEVIVKNFPSLIRNNNLHIHGAQ